MNSYQYKNNKAFSAINICNINILITVVILLLFVKSPAYSEGNITYLGGSEPHLVRQDMFKSQGTKIKLDTSTGKLPLDSAEEINFLKGKFNVLNTKVNLDAETISFTSDDETITASGGLLLGYPSGLIEADEVFFKNRSDDIFLSGDIKINDNLFDAWADELWLNLETKEMGIQNGEVSFADGSYNFKAEKISKDKTQTYYLEDAEITSCICPESDDVCPWKIKASETKVEYDGYGTAKNAVFEVDGLPILYLPYLSFPAKVRRQTGFLPPTIGTSKYSPFELEVPFYIVLDDSSDMTVTPTYDATTRFGSLFEFRKAFSKNHTLELGGSYFDESMRDGDLQGLSTDGIYDPELKEKRYTLLLEHNFETQINGDKLQLITDARYANDKLLISEEIDPRMNPSDTRFLTSTSVTRMTFSDKYMLETELEYNESVVDNQDYVFQRAPSIYLSGSEYYDVFGDNKFGAQLVLDSTISSVNFLRNKGYDGNRTEAYERISVPFNYKNIFKAELSTDLRVSYYGLFDYDAVDSSSNDMKRNTTRFVPGFTYKMSTALERVFNVSDGNIIKTLADLGPQSVSRELVRVKHVLEPFVQYRYVPDINQEENPIFDYDDYISDKSLMTYGVSNVLYGRYENYNENIYGISEIMPELADLEQLRENSAFSDEFGVRRVSKKARGRIRELARLDIAQAVNVFNREDKSENLKTSSNDMSDLMALLKISPNEHFYLRFKANYDVDNSKLSEYSFEPRFVDNRGDEVRLKYQYIDNRLDQISGGAQIKLTRNTKFGYYAIFDSGNSKFMEERYALRFFSSCNCWTADIGYSRKYNPRNETIMLSVNLLGLGEFGSSFSALNKNER